MVQPTETSLWKSAFDATSNDTPTQAEARTALMMALKALSKPIADLLARIPESCKGLTLHDISHVAQLWDVASTICGPEYPINPSEGFVLGAAFLLHDAGLTVAAYPGGVDALRKTDFYRDLVAAALKQKDPDRVLTDTDFETASADVADAAMFALLRHIHADRAERLLEQEYKHPLLGTTYGLISSDLLLDFGEIIGQVAASHHWDVKRVDDVFPEPHPPRASYPGWTIDGLKLASILRSADACAIDERRARTMAFLLENSRGVSRAHWAFQANLSPCHLPDGRDALVFRSKRQFPRIEMDSWWVAFDAITLADRELRACDRILKRRAGRDGHDLHIPLSAKRVEGAADADVLKDYLKVTSDWKPVDTAARIDDPTRIIKSLGGANLYGGDLTVPLRELIQNAADAVRARRALGGYGAATGEFPGRIEVTIEASEKFPGKWRLTVADDGVGMTEDVLTGEFLDFGSSLWSSRRLATVHPGLNSNKKFRPTGRFGIGFFSTFMLSPHVCVFSKSFRHGMDSYKVLEFRNGIASRAELRTYEGINIGRISENNTFVMVDAISDLFIAQIGSMYANFWENINKSTNYEEQFKRVEKSIKKLVFALEVDLFLSYPGAVYVKTNISNIFRIKDIAFHEEAESQLMIGDDAVVERRVYPVETVGDSDTSRTRGWINIRQTGGAAVHVGGLTVPHSYDSRFQGICERHPSTAARAGGGDSAENAQSFILFGNRLLERINDITVTDQEKMRALVGIFNMNQNLRGEEFFSDYNHNIIYIKNIGIKNGMKIVIPVREENFSREKTIAEPVLKSMYIKFVQEDLAEWQCDLFIGANSEDSNGLYFSIDENEKLNPANYTAFNCLKEKIRREGFNCTIERRDEIAVCRYIGEDGGRGRIRDALLKSGSILTVPGIVLTIV